MAIYNDYLIVGSIFDDDFNQNSGSAYIYKLIGDSWTFINKIYSNIPYNNNNFSQSLVLNGEYLAVSSLNNNACCSQAM